MVKLLHSAVEKGCLVIIVHVLKHCPDVNNRSNRSDLNVAVHGSGKEYGEIVKNLLHFGFTVSPEDVNDCKLLHAAVGKGYLRIVEAPLKYGTDVNMLYGSTGCMPLHVATKNKQEEVAKLLINYGADVNTQDETGKTPIFYATQNADLKITKLFLTNKANVKDSPELLNIAVKKECRENVEILLENVADVNTSDENGRTALRFTAWKDGKFFGFYRKDPDIYVKGEIAKLLLSRGANVNAQTKNGITTLHAATQKVYVNVEVLLEYKPDVNCTVKVDEVRLKLGANFDSKAEYGRTALHIACKAGHEQIVIALLEHGSDINIMSKNNETPLDFAMAGVRSFYKKGNSYDYNYDHDPDEYYVDDFDDYYYYHGCGIRRFKITVDSYDHYGDY
jgi:ankyrin repeat protein